jgi:hypothetical protein
MIIPVTVLTLAWFIIINHVYVRRVRASKTAGLGNTFYKETTQFLYRFLVVGAAFSSAAVLLIGLNNDHTKLANLTRLQRGVDGADRVLRTVWLTPATTFVLLLLIYGLTLAVRHEQLQWPAKLRTVRSRADRILPALALFVFMIFFASRVGDPSFDPSARVRDIREGYASYRAEMQRELAARTAERGTEQLRAASADLRAIDGLRDSLWRARAAVLTAYASVQTQSEQPVRLARIDTVRGTWTDSERQIVRRIGDAGSDAAAFLPAPVANVTDEVPRSLSVERTRALREELARERARREADQRARPVILGDAVKQIGNAAITMYLGDVAESLIAVTLSDRLAEVDQIDPTLRYVPPLFLDAMDSRVKARFADQASLIGSRQAEADEPLASTLDSSTRRVVAELRPASLDPAGRTELARRLRVAIDDARARIRAIEAARRAAERQLASAEAPPSERVDTLWNELVTLWLGSDGPGEGFTLDLRDNEALRREAARVLGRDADSVTLTPPADALRLLSENYNHYVRGLGDERAERELEELVQSARAEPTPARRVQVITIRALQRVPQALNTGLGIR